MSVCTWAQCPIVDATSSVSIAAPDHGVHTVSFAGWDSPPRMTREPLRKALTISPKWNSPTTSSRAYMQDAHITWKVHCVRHVSECPSKSSISCRELGSEGIKMHTDTQEGIQESTDIICLHKHRHTPTDRNTGCNEDPDTSIMS
jgi:hypothetical protein